MLSVGSNSYGCFLCLFAVQMHLVSMTSNFFLFGVQSALSHAEALYGVPLLIALDTQLTKHA